MWLYISQIGKEYASLSPSAKEQEKCCRSNPITINQSVADTLLYSQHCTDAEEETQKFSPLQKLTNLDGKDI